MVCNPTDVPTQVGTIAAARRVEGPNYPGYSCSVVSFSVIILLLFRFCDSFYFFLKTRNAAWLPFGGG